MVTGYTRPPHWPCGCEPPSWEVNQSQPPWAAGAEDGFQEERRGEDAGSCFYKEGPPSVPASLVVGPPLCLAWSKELGSSAPRHTYSLREQEASLPQTSTLWSGFIPLHSVCVCSPSERKRRCKLEGWPPDQESRRRLSKQALAAAAWRAACSQPRVTQGSLPESSAGLCGISGLPGLPDQNDPERNGHKNALCAKVYKAFFYTFYP